jgi:dolichol-phosphate mannosyltransferase
MYMSQTRPDHTETQAEIDLSVARPSYREEENDSEDDSETTSSMGCSLPDEQISPLLSVVIPLLNEEEVIGETYRKLKEQLESLLLTYELVFVDDGSTDKSRTILTAISRFDPSVRVVGLSRNFGHEMATTAGLNEARGQAVVVIDADLQDPPELIEEFVGKWREGYQVVYGVRQERRGETLLKKTTSFIFYRLMGRISDVAIPPDTGDFRLMDRRVVDVYKGFLEEPRFFRGLISWIGFPQVGVPFVRRQRAGGRTKYRYTRLVKLALDTITAFSTLPALCITLLAGSCVAFSLLFTTVVLFLWATGLVHMEGWMWAGIGFLGLWNLQFCSIAMLGEYIVRTHRHTQHRPLYVVESLIEGGIARNPGAQHHAQRRRSDPALPQRRGVDPEVLT